MHQINNIRIFFTDLPRMGFKDKKSLKNHLVRSVLSKIDAAGNSSPCGAKRPPSEMWKLMKKTSFFKKRNSDEIYHINCNFKNTVYHIECNQCWKQYTGSSKTKSCYRAKIIKGLIVNLRRKDKFAKTFPQILLLRWPQWYSRFVK